MKSIIPVVLFLVVGLSACEKSDPIIPNEEELITTVVYELTPVAGGTAVTFSYTDLDGDGGNAPVISNGILSANTEYVGTLTLLNEQDSPAENITEEVEEEAEEHQFFYQSTSTELSVSYDDLDANGKPIGLSTKLTTLNTDTTVLTIILKHEPDKEGVGVSNGDPTNSGGETDIEISFNVEIQ